MDEFNIVLTVNEVAPLLHLNPSTLRRYLHNGLVRHVSQKGLRGSLFKYLIPLASLMESIWESTDGSPADKEARLRAILADLPHVRRDVGMSEVTAMLAALPHWVAGHTAVEGGLPRLEQVAEYLGELTRTHPDVEGLQLALQGALQALDELRGRVQRAIVAGGEARRSLG